MSQNNGSRYDRGQGYPDQRGYRDQGYPNGGDPRYQNRRGGQRPSGQGNPGQGYPGQDYPRQGYSGQGYSGQGNPGQGYPGQGYQDPGYYQGRGYPGQVYQRQNPPRQGYPGQGYPGQRNPNQGYPGGGPPRTPNRGSGSRYPDNRKPGDDPKGKKGSPAFVIVMVILLIAAIIGFSFAAFKLYGWYREYKAADDEYDGLQQYSEQTTSETEPAIQPGGGAILNDVTQLEDPATVEQKKEQAATEETVENNEKKQLPLLKNPINFDELNAINEEIVGWIRIGALDVSYPVAQARDNDYYLHRTFERKDNFAGCIFLNCENSKFFTDQNSIVYGHNMKNGSMFGTLKDYREQKTYDANPYFWIFTPTLIYQYRIFSTAEVSAEGDVYRIRFTSADYDAFLKNRAASSLVTTGVTPGVDDRIVTLSTCTGNDATRFVVQGVLEQIYISK